MDALITYDVSKHGNSEVKAGMLAKGYLDNWKFGETIYYLPSTSLWKSKTDLSTALADIKSVVAAINKTRSPNNQVRLERCIVVPCDSWDGIPGDQHR